MEGGNGFHRCPDGARRGGDGDKWLQRSAKAEGKRKAPKPAPLQGLQTASMQKREDDQFLMTNIGAADLSALPFLYNRMAPHGSCSRGARH